MNHSYQQAPQQERLQKVIARLGIASRRHAEKLISKGLVKVNGRVVTQLGTKVSPQDKIEVLDPSKKKVVQRDSVGEQGKFVYYLLHKPVGVITSVYDPQGRKTVIDLIRQDVKQRVYPVGRLDYDTSGLLLLTNDGDLTYRLTHPRFEVKKIYKAWIKGRISAEAIKTLQEGVKLQDGVTAPAKIIKVQQANRGNSLSVVEISIHEGKNRQVRRMFEAVGYPLVGLQRIAFGPLKLNNLKPGEFRPLKVQEVARLQKEVGLNTTEY